MAVGGDIIEITYNHPTLGTGTFFPKAGEDNSYFPGGVLSESADDGIDGAGNPIWRATRKRAFFEVVVANDQNQRNDLEIAIALSAHPVPANWTFSIINGVVYGGQGKPVPDFEGNVGQSTFTLRVEGGVFKKIVG